MFNMGYKVMCYAFVVISIAFSSCSNNIEKEIRTFMQSEIVLPVTEMERFECSLFPEHHLNPIVYIVHYYNSPSCGSCEASNIENEESLYYKKYPDVCFVYIFRTSPKEEKLMYKNLCAKRVKGVVYIDTSGVFQKENPQIPSQRIFHTFVLNSGGEILMVGNPFANDRMRQLFHNVLKEQKEKCDNKQQPFLKQL